MRVVLQCFAPLSKRRIKIRQSKTNHQDAYLPEDVSVHSVIFVACGAAPECQGWAERAGEPIDGVGSTELDDSDDVGNVAATTYYENEFARDDDVDGGMLEHQVHSMLVRLRIHVHDPRTALAVAEDMLDLLDLRQQFCVLSTRSNTEASVRKSSVPYGRVCFGICFLKTSEAIGLSNVAWSRKKPE